MPTKRKATRNEMRMDPQCGKSVKTKGAVSVRWEGKTYFFCSQGCKARFAVDPPGDAGF